MRRLCLYDERVQIADADENGEEGKVYEQKFQNIFFRFAGANTSVCIERDEARKRGDGRTQPAYVDRHEQVRVIGSEF